MTTVDALVSDYLGRLDAAAIALPPERRSELLGEIGEHIATAQAAGAEDEVSVRTLLDRLGTPEEIVAAARDDGGDGGWGSSALTTRRPGTGLELAAVLMLTAGSLLPVVGWLVGIVLLWVSTRWRVREKLLGTLVVPLGPGTVLYAGGLFIGRSESCYSDVPAPAGQPAPADVVVCTSTGPPEWVTQSATLLLVVAPIVVAVVLMRNARRRAAAEPPILVPSMGPAYGPAPRTSPWGGLEVTAVLLLGLGGFVVPVVPLLVGLALACASPQWSGRVKVAAAAVMALPVLALPAFYLSAGRLSVPGSVLFAYGIGPVGGLLTAALLGATLPRRRGEGASP